jgi:hypothetical protein
MAAVAASEAALQVIAAFVIFVVGYLVLLLFIVFCVVIATILYKGATLVRSYTTHVNPLDDDGTPEVKDNGRWPQHLCHYSRSRYLLGPASGFTNKDRIQNSR